VFQLSTVEMTAFVSYSLILLWYPRIRLLCPRILLLYVGDDDAKVLNSNPNPSGLDPNPFLFAGP